MKFFATIPKNLEPLLAQELTDLGAKRVRPTGSGAFFEGELEDAYRIILWSRLAHSVLLPLAHFPAPTDHALYQGVKKIKWAEHMRPSMTLAVDATSTRSALDHTHFIALRTKDAIVDQFRESAGQRPDVDTDAPDLRVNVHLRRDEATVSLDLSGAKMHRRGWRQQSVAAPLKETTAAAILTRGGWPELAKEGAPLFDPMCGSGTFAIEAWMMAADVAPGLLRQERPGFVRWLGHQKETWERLMQEARQRRVEGEAGVTSTIVACDMDHAAIRATRQNVQNLGITTDFRISQRDLVDMRPPPDTAPGLFVANPPYGERLEVFEQVRLLHEELGEVLKQHFYGWKACVLTSGAELGLTIPLRASKRYTVYNGPLECLLLLFDVREERFYQG